MDEKPFVKVDGQGEVKTEPDRAILGFGIETYGSSLKDVQQQNAQRASSALNKLQSLGIKSADIQSSQVRITPRYTFDR
jgi:uncharacterized protein YggE